MESEMSTKGAAGIGASAERRGLEHETTQEDLTIPRARLLQALSPDVIERPSEFHSGMIINSITKQQFARDERGGHLFIVALRLPPNWIRFNPRDAKNAGYDPNFGPGAMVWRSSDPNDPKVVAEGRFGPNGEPPIAIKFLNFLCHFYGEDMPIILSFSKTSYRMGKNLNTILQFAKGDAFDLKFRLSSKHEKTDMGAYYVLNVEGAGKVERDSQEYILAESLWESFHARAGEIKVHDEAEAASESDADGPAGEKPPF